MSTVLHDPWDEAAESILWRRVTLSGRDWPGLGYCDELLDDTMDYDLESWVLERCAQLRAAVTSQPRRISYVRELVMECTRSTANHNITLLLGTWANLRLLAISAAESLGGSLEFQAECVRNLRTIYQCLPDIQPSKNLLTLSICLTSNERQNELSSFLRLAPEIKHRNIDFHGQPEPLPFETSLYPPVIALAELRMTVTCETFPLLSTLLRKTRCLKRLTLLGTRLDHSEVSEEDVKALALCDSLRHVRLDDEDGEDTNMFWHSVLALDSAFVAVEILESRVPCILGELWFGRSIHFITNLFSRHGSRLCHG